MRPSECVTLFSVSICKSNKKREINKNEFSLMQLVILERKTALIVLNRNYNSRFSRNIVFPVSVGKLMDYENIIKY